MYSQGFEDPMLAEPPVWPKVIGILSIVFASMGLTCGGCGVVGLVLLMASGAQLSDDPLPPPMQPDVTDWALMGLSMLMSVLLLVAGIVTVMRRPAGRALHLLYAVLDLPLVIASTAMSIQQMNEMAQWAANNPDSQWAQQQNMPGANVGQYVGLAFGLLMGVGYPIFLLIWFGMIKRRAEDMTGGVAEPAA